MFKVETFRTKNEAVYNFLQANILAGNLKGGEKLNVGQISKKLNVSGIPIREALKSLKSEKLIEYIPHLGARVIQINKKELEEIHTIRRELECLATRMAAPNMKENDFKKLDEINEEFEQVIQSDKYEKRISEINKEFHLFIYKKSNNTLLFKMIVDLWSRSQLIPSGFAQSLNNRIQSHKEHKLILKALKAGNGDLAAEITHKQKLRAWEEMVKYG